MKRKPSPKVAKVKSERIHPHFELGSTPIVRVSREEMITKYKRDPQEYSPPATREPLPPHVELTPAAIRAWYNGGKE